jgi:hypothetical protein
MGGTANVSMACVATFATFGPSREIVVGSPLLWASAFHAPAVFGPYNPSRATLTPRSVKIFWSVLTVAVVVGVEPPPNGLKRASALVTALAAFLFAAALRTPGMVELAGASLGGAVCNVARGVLL